MALDGKVVLVTGGFGDLGGAVAHAAQARGAKVVQLGHGAAPAEGIDGRLVIGGVDLADEAQTAEVIGQAATVLGGFDAVFNIAGAFEWRPVAQAEAALWLKLMKANVLTAAVVSRAALPHLKPGATILNVGAVAGRKATAGMGPYAAAKAGVLRLTEALAAELAEEDVWVGSVSPTTLDTPRNRKDMPEADWSAWTKPQALAERMLDLVEGVGRGESGADLAV